MRVIDADALIDKYGDWYTEEGSEEGFIGTIKSLVDTMPTIEPEPCEDVPDTNVGKIECDYVVSAVAVEEMLKNLLPARGMWEIEGDEAKNAICETVYDALKGLWKLPFARPEVIFCEECRHWDGEKRGQFYYFERCSLHRCSALSNNFCSWAERREDDK